MGKVFLAVLAVTLFVYAVFDLIATPKSRVKGLPKALWFVLVVLFPVVGPLLWLVLGHERTWRPSGGGRPGPRRPNGPDDDPDYLRGL